MNRHSETWILLAALSLGILTGCSGWGSSGPKSSGGGPAGLESAFSVEQEAIDQVTQEGGCVDVDGTTICAPDASFPEDTTGDVATNGIGGSGPEAEALTIQPESGTEIPCSLVPERDACTFNLTVRQTGFPPDTLFFAAIRLQDGPSSWESGLSPFVASSEDPFGLELTVRVGGVILGETFRMQLAVLVFLPESDLPPVSTGDQLLRDFAADRIYVVEDVSVVVVESGDSP